MTTARYRANQTQVREFGEVVLSGLRSTTFGSVPKAELELLLFRAMIDAGILSMTSPVFDLARQLEITPSRVRSLIYRYRLQTQPDDDAVLAEIAGALGRSRFELTEQRIVFGIEDPYLRDSLGALLKQQGIFADTSFNPETVSLGIGAFVDFVSARFDTDDRVRILRALHHDTGVEPSAFKRVLKSTLAQLGKRVVGAAADDLASAAIDAVWSFTTSLFRGDVEQATTAAREFA
ncbi:hypothetical protein [Galbitalea soli]|uniref:Uncharacterized protein n=1 Tax=Galbitalea soli TaxID=1268042 RepID=A0A7C9TQ84_9MICO|nr:hypothetical protein [Galbitalea soli]NEM90103.1 hypothetical protein [Galbitalea soli]NYJ30810.1 hypothetical protein [Galbitalea soli]